jgi:hypothetical protein
LDDWGICNFFADPFESDGLPAQENISAGGKAAGGSGRASVLKKQRPTTGQKCPKVEFGELSENFRYSLVYSKPITFKV